jgi:hypothetical protein
MEWMQFLLGKGSDDPTKEPDQAMPAHLNWQKGRACDGSLIAAAEPEETLVDDARAGLTPAQMVERKLMALLKISDPGAFTGSSERTNIERKQKARFRMADAIQEGRQRVASDRRIVGILRPRTITNVSAP